MEIRSMDILKRHTKYRNYYLIGALILALVTAALIFFSIRSVDTKNAEKLNEITKGDYGYVEIDGFIGPFAYTETGKEYYYLTLLDNQDLLIIDLDGPTHREWQRYTTDEAAFEAVRPLRIEGRIQSVRSDLKPFAKAAYNEAGYEGILPDDAPLLQNFLSTTDKAGLSTTMLVFGIVAGIFMLSLLIGAWIITSRLKKSKAILSEKYPHHDDFRFIDERKDLDIPNRRIFVKDSLLISEKAGLTIQDLDDLGWMHYQAQRSRYSTQPYLIVYSKSQKNKKQMMALAGRAKGVEDDLQPLYAYVHERYPSVIIGRSKENKQLYRSRFE